MNKIHRILWLNLLVLLSVVSSVYADDALREEARAAMHNAAEFFRNEVASHGGYVYHYTDDLSRRWGEGEATRDQIWVEPPGTPTVGMAYLEAYEATGDEFYLDAAREAAEALVYGQVKSGGWANCIDFDPKGSRVSQYRNGRGGGRNRSSLDDGQTQSAIRLLMRFDDAVDGKHEQVREAVQFALDTFLAAQFPNGGFPQSWTGPAEKHPIVKASYPDYDWRTEHRLKNYWDMYTTNDNVPGHAAKVLIEAHEFYGDERYMTALKKVGDFLILAQIPDPQPAWAQQYNYEMKPVWARKFEPPGISGDESQEAIDTLMEICRATGDRKYLEPIPAALSYLKRSRLPDGRLARFYELKTNRPLYFVSETYKLTYDDSNTPDHYAFKIDSRLDDLEKQYEDLRRHGPREPTPPSAKSLEGRVRSIIKDLDDQGRWLSVAKEDRLTGALKLEPGSRYISSAVFSRNIETLSQYLMALNAK